MTYQFEEQPDMPHFGRGDVVFNDPASSVYVEDTTNDVWFDDPSYPDGVNLTTALRSAEPASAAVDVYTLVRIVVEMARELKARGVMLSTWRHLNEGTEDAHADLGHD